MAVMQWSKLKGRVKPLICDELRSRIDFHVTGYHRRRSTKVRSGVITVDGEPIAKLSYDRFQRESCGWYGSVRGELDAGGIWGGPSSAETAWSVYQSDEIHPPQQLGEAMRAFLEMPVLEALKSANPFIRSFAIIDRRIGRRTLEDMEIGETDHSLVQAFYSLRMETLASKPR
jgi:hypothetical protein